MEYSRFEGPVYAFIGYHYYFPKMLPLFSYRLKQIAAIDSKCLSLNKPGVDYVFGNWFKIMNEKKDTDKYSCVTIRAIVLPDYDHCRIDSSQ